MKNFLLTLILFFSAIHSNGQSEKGIDSTYFIKINQLIDSYVVQQNVAALDTLYANDFVFSHGSGRIEGKTRWLTSVKKNNYPIRNHDSVTVELHADIAILRGKMAIQRVSKETIVKYNLKYVRVFAIRNKQWQLVSHITTDEQHEQ